MHDNQLGNGMWDTMWDVNSGKQVNSRCRSLAGVNSVDSNRVFLRSRRSCSVGRQRSTPFLFPLPIVLKFSRSMSTFSNNIYSLINQRRNSKTCVRTSKSQPSSFLTVGICSSQSHFGRNTKPPFSFPHTASSLRLRPQKR